MILTGNILRLIAMGLDVFFFLLILLTIKNYRAINYPPIFRHFGILCLSYAFSLFYILADAIEHINRPPTWRGPVIIPILTAGVVSLLRINLYFYKSRHG